MMGRWFCEGVVVPMLTPLEQDGSIDLGCARKMAGRLAQAGTFVFVLGTTGEGFSIPLKKREELVRAVMNELGKQAIVYAGVPSNCLETQIELGNRYIELGVSIIVVHLPCYYKLSEREMLRYLEQAAGGIEGPVVIYNIPQTVGQSLPLVVIEELSHRDNIIGLKDTEEDEKRFGQAMAMWGRREDFSYLIGHSPFAVTGLFMNAKGWVPTVGNLVPDLCRGLYDAARRGERQTVERTYRQISEVRAVCRSIAEYKYAASLMGLCGRTVLPPLLEPDDEHKRQIKERLMKMGITG
jgi:dihydrodipicolinate synthase/N-acetylneuraminate lyase